MSEDFLLYGKVKSVVIVGAYPGNFTVILNYAKKTNENSKKF